MKRFFTLLTLCLLAVACNDASRDPVIKGYRITRSAACRSDSTG